MTNKEISQRKIKELLEKDSLVISTNQIVVPVLCYIYLDAVTFTKIALTARASYNARHGLAPIATKSIKASLTKDNVQKIVDKYELDSDKLYINMHDANAIINDQWDIKTYPELFDSYVVTHSSLDHYFWLKKQFFKKMPMLHEYVFKVMSEHDINSSYCCEDCDGDYDAHMKFNVEYYDKSKIKTKLSKLKIKTK